MNVSARNTISIVYIQLFNDKTTRYKKAKIVQNEKASACRVGQKGNFFRRKGIVYNIKRVACKIKHWLTCDSEARPHFLKHLSKKERENWILLSRYETASTKSLLGTFRVRDSHTAIPRRRYNSIRRRQRTE